ncbi:hypothetical protein WJX73_000505 [Symbiochloris irregularis]|uniref:NrS-1 polymerase-like helicase domain-containing protein n=1 Tax=Symbiochloris irregularis TaxID=706552 RepID=A0AAW1NT56_9CHLO
MFTAFEYLQDDALTKPYFDYEEYHDEEPHANDIHSVLCTLKDSIRDCFMGEDGFDENKQVAYAQRHGWVGGSLTPRRFKLSFRAYVMGYAIRYTQMPHFLKEYGGGWKFDLSVYKAGGQLYGCVGGCKGLIPGKDMDARMLVPLTHHSDARAFLVQALDGDEKVLQCTSPKTSSSKFSRPVTNEAVGFEGIDSRIYPAAMSALLVMDPPDSTSWCRKATMTPSDGSVSLHMRTRGERKCPQGESHHSNNFYIRATRQGLLLYKCLGSVCIESPQLKIGRWIDPFNDLQSLDMVHVKTLEKNEYLRYFNRFFAVVKSDRPVFVQFHYNSRGKLVRYNERTLAATREIMAPCKAAFEAWHFHPEKRQYDEIVYEPDPSMVAPDKLNTFVDLKVELENDVHNLPAVDMGVIGPVLWHIEQILCRGHSDFYQYLLRWMALPLQRPGERTETMPCINGDQGSGKGLIFNQLLGRGIYGDHTYVQVKNATDDLLGKFNHLTARRRFIMIDEIKSFGDAFKQSETLKNLITEPRTTLQRKGLDSVDINNYANYFLATNAEVPLKVEGSDRRYACIRASNAKCGDLDYFKSLAETCKAPQTALHFYKYLLSLDLSEWNARKIPMTQEKREMMTVVIEPEWSFMQDQIEEGTFKQTVPTKILFLDFLAFCERPTERVPIAGKKADGLVKLLKRHMPQMYTDRASVPDVFGQVKQQRCVFFPDADIVRRYMIANKKWVD